MNLREYQSAVATGKAISYVSVEAFRESPMLFHGAICEQEGVKPLPTSSATWDMYRFILTHTEEAFEAEYIVSDGPINSEGAKATGRPFGRETKTYQNWVREICEARNITPDKIVGTEEAKKMHLMYQHLRMQLNSPSLDDYEVVKAIDNAIGNPETIGEVPVFVEYKKKGLDVPCIAHYDFKVRVEGEDFDTFVKIRPTSRFEWLFKDIENDRFVPAQWGQYVLGEALGKARIVYLLQSGEYPYKLTVAVWGADKSGHRSMYAVVEKIGECFKKQEFPIQAVVPVLSRV